MNRLMSGVMWVAISLAGAGAFGYIAVERGETISAAWLVVAGRELRSAMPAAPSAR